MVLSNQVLWYQDFNSLYKAEKYVLSINLAVYILQLLRENHVEGFKETYYEIRVGYGCIFLDLFVQKFKSSQKLFHFGIFLIYICLFLEKFFFKVLIEHIELKRLRTASLKQLLLQEEVLWQAKSVHDLDEDILLKTHPSADVRVIKLN